MALDIRVRWRIVRGGNCGALKPLQRACTSSAPHGFITSHPYRNVYVVHPHPLHARDLGGAVATRLVWGLNDVMVQTRIRVGIRSPDQWTTAQPASHRPSCWISHSKKTWGLGQLRAGPSRASMVQLTRLWLFTGTEWQRPPSLNQPPISSSLYYVLSV